MNPIARNWKVPRPKSSLSRSLSLSSSPSIQRSSSSKDLFTKKTEKIEAKNIKNIKNIDVVLRAKGCKDGDVWSISMCSIVYNEMDDIFIVPHLRRIPYFFKELGMITTTLDLILDKIYTNNTNNTKIVKHYAPSLMMDDIFFDEILSNIDDVILLIIFSDVSLNKKMRKVEVINFNGK